MDILVRGIAYHLPEQVLTNQQLSTEFPDWPIDKIESKTGIVDRHIAGREECASDLAYQAAIKLFAGGLSPKDVDFLLFCTQSPDYFLPTTACILQDRLGIPTSAGALDFNMGCSGFIYGLSLAHGMIASKQAKNVLLLTADTYSKFLDPQDRGVRTIFGDAAAATWIGSNEGDNSHLGPTLLGTDGRGAENLIVRGGGLRHPNSSTSAVDPYLRMNGGEIFAFTLRVVPDLVNRLLQKAGITANDVDHFVFHQANRYMLDSLRQKMGIPPEKFVVELRDCGNTVSSTIPIALKRSAESGRIKPGDLLMLVGFGVGYSWGATMLRWHGLE